MPASVSLVASSDPAMRRAVRLLRMVHELHKAGYQLLRICPGCSLDMKEWHCYIGAVSSFHDDGWTPAEDAQLALYTSGQGDTFFGWDNVGGHTARELATDFIARFPLVAESSVGTDWAYAGWLATVLGTAERGQRPELFGGGNYELNAVGTPLPPRPAGEHSAHPGTVLPLVSSDALTLTDLPPTGAGWEDLSRFCLSFDGYRCAGLVGIDSHEVAQDAGRGSLTGMTMESLRLMAFMLQRAIRSSGRYPPAPDKLMRIREVVEEIRRRIIHKEPEHLKDALSSVDGIGRVKALPQQTAHWSEDPLWSDALTRYLESRDRGRREFRINMGSWESELFNGDSPAYKLMDAMESVTRMEGWDGYRGAPRLVLAMLQILEEGPRTAPPEN